jgi:hypothetical protein
MVVSQCYECGAPIDGGSHTLLASNTRDEGMEAEARALGAMRNPHVV